MSKSMPFDLTIKGLRIPFVAAWEKEPPRIQLDPTVNHDAVYSGVVDHRESASNGELGKVLLGQMAPQRQRYVMKHGLCQVCGRKMAVSVLMGHAQHHGPDQLLAVDEPPCCPACALMAIELCPYVGRQWAESGALIVAESKLALQLARLLPGDDRTKFNRSGQSLSRAMFRRYLNKPLCIHLRMMPIRVGPISGEHGICALRGIAKELPI